LIFDVVRDFLGDEALDGQDKRLYIIQARPETVQSLKNYNILEEYRIAKVRAFAAGIADGIFRRLGPCRRKWLLRAD